MLPLSAIIPTRLSRIFKTELRSGSSKKLPVRIQKENKKLFPYYYFILNVIIIFFFKFRAGSSAAGSFQRIGQSKTIFLTTLLRVLAIPQKLMERSEILHQL